MGACFSAPKTAAESLKSTISAKVHESPKIKKVPSAQKSGTVVPTSVLNKPLKNVSEDYELGKELGRGLFGVTRLVTDRKTGVQLACKSINKVHSTRTVDVNKTKRRITIDNYDIIRREADILAHLSSASPHVASLVATYEDESHVHLVMELCTGGMLYDSITARGYYSERQAAALLRNMVQIVQYVHDRGVIHRDYKLENFLLASPAEGAPLTAIDFGLSTFFKPGDKFSEIVGSAYYVAPEVLKKSYGPEIDIWSIGVILYMLLCGVPPFWDVSDAGICALVMKGEYDLKSEPWPSISDSAKDLIRKLLEMDPAKRLTAAQILEHEWVVVDGVASDKPISSPVMLRVREFMTMNRIKRYALSVIAGSCLDPAEMQVIRAKFDRLDANKDGLLTFEEVLTGLRELKLPITETDVRGFFDAADVDNTKTLTFSKYASAIMVKRLSEDRIRAAFNHFDREGRGYINADRFRELMASFGIQEDVELIIGEVDKNKDGKIDYEEFEMMMLEGVDEFKGPVLSKLEDYYSCMPVLEPSDSEKIKLSDSRNVEPVETRVLNQSNQSS